MNIKPMVRALAHAALACALHAQAQAAAEVEKPSGTSTLGAGLRKVWTQHPDVRQALSEMRAADRDVNGAKTGYYPSLLVQALQTDRSTANGSTGNGTLARLSIPLYSGGSTGAEIDAASARREQAEHNLALVRLNLGVRYGDAYIAAVAAQSQADLLDQNLSALRKLNLTIARRAAEGAAPDADVKTAITRVRLAESQLAQARGQEAAQRVALKALQGDSPGPLGWPVGEGLTHQEMDQAYDQALGVNPNVLRANAEITYQQAVARLNRSRLSPELRLEHQKGIGGLADSRTYPEQTQFVLQVQTDNMFRGYESWKGASERINGAQARRESALLDLQQSLYASRAQIESIILQMRSQRLAVDASTSSVDSFLRQYSVGRKTWIEVLNAQREATDTQLQYVTQLQNYWQAVNRMALNGMYWEEWAQRTMVVGSRDALETKP